MTRYYPAFLALEGRPCLVVGGGAVAERKAKGLIDSGASITVISPELTARLRRLVEKGHIKHVCRGYQAGDLQGAYLIVAATNDKLMNRSISIEAREAGVIVNAVDDPDHCDFIAPSIVRRGDITFAISTAGASPALARWLRKQVESKFPSQFGELATVLSQVRKQLSKEGRRVSPAAWQRSIDSELLTLIKDRKRKEAKLHLLASLANGRKGSKCHPPLERESQSARLGPASQPESISHEG